LRQLGCLISIREIVLRQLGCLISIREIALRQLGCLQACETSSLVDFSI
jgi:hypothetical protein